MLSEKFRPILEPFTAGTGKALARVGLTPNALTTIGVVAMFGCGWLIVAGHRRLAGLLLIPAFFIDVFDGALARATGRVTAWGGFYDSVCDRIADGVLLGAIAWLGYEHADSWLLGSALIAMIVQSLVPYARAKGEALGLRVPSGPGERAERAVLIIAGLILQIEEAAMWLLVVMAVYTFVARSLAVRRQTTAPPA